MKPPLPQRIVCRTVVCFFLLITACTPNHFARVHLDSIALYYQDDDTGEVLFASSIDQYRFHQAREVEGGVWEVIVPRVAEFSYFYRVDKILVLPDCQTKILDDFGSKMCLFVSEL